MRIVGCCLSFVSFVLLFFTFVGFNVGRVVFFLQLAKLGDKFWWVREETIFSDNSAMNQSVGVVPAGCDC